jgi:cyclic pyranopterin phosphate synthase
VKSSRKVFSASFLTNDISMTNRPKTSTHFDDSGQARMVDVSKKAETFREATAVGKIRMSQEGFQMVKSGNIAKGDVLGVARLAGIMAVKQVDRLIPLAHPLNITKAEVEFKFIDPENTIEIEATVGITGKTGVEMEALMAVSIAALTIYDMSKSVDKNMTISDIKLLYKSGGKSGTYRCDR